ncbi:MAG: hypothetical protein JNM66_31355 [Bryobacterales bacterium]|nr:hypothetical protein [Bryobacterales bacterium]
MQLAGKHSGPATRGFLLGNHPAPAPYTYLGLDLGQRQDHSALSVIDLAWTSLGRCAASYQYLFLPVLTVRSVERYPLNISYEEIPHIVRSRTQQIADRRRGSGMELVIDAGGPGAPMVDHLRRIAPSNLLVSPVFITAGKAVSRLAGGYTGVPRRVLITQLVKMIAAGCLVCPASLPGMSTWRDEMLSLSGCGAHPEKTGSHDDLTLAIALAAWAAVRRNPELAPDAASSLARNRLGQIDWYLF